MSGSVFSSRRRPSLALGSAGRVRGPQQNQLLIPSFRWQEHPIRSDPRHPVCRPAHNSRSELRRSAGAERSRKPTGPPCADGGLLPC
eukprot:2380152-Prymnesium_polylepis.1